MRLRGVGGVVVLIFVLSGCAFAPTPDAILDPAPVPSAVSEFQPWMSTPGPADDSGERAGATGTLEVSGGTGNPTYVVAQGDTASDIVARFGVGIEQLIDESGQRLGASLEIFPGDRIQFGLPLTGDDYDCFFGAAAPLAKGESCYDS